MEALITISIIIVIIVGLYFESDAKNKGEKYGDSFDKKTTINDYLLGIKDFCATQQLIGVDDNSALAIDEQKDEFYLINKSQEKFLSRVILYKDLLSVEIFEDGETISSTVRSSQIGGALIGGIALGGIGAVIGGLSGKTKSSDKVEKIILRLVVNDTKNPLHEVYFLNFATGIKKKDSRYQEAMQKARHWNSLIEVLIKRADMEDKENSANNVVQISQSSIADEIKKLAELRDAGILSDAEFQQQKEKLLG